jgi:two-component system, OmpR family, response regulator MprA
MRNRTRLIAAAAAEELRARLRALLRRSGAGTEVVRFAGFELDLAADAGPRGP